MNIFHSPKQRAIAKKKAQRQAKKAHRAAKKLQQREAKIIASLEAIANISYQSEHEEWQNIFSSSCIKKSLAKAYKPVMNVSVKKFLIEHTDRVWNDNKDEWNGGKTYFLCVLKNKDASSWKEAKINTRIGLYMLDNSSFKSLYGLHRAMITKA